MQIQTVIYIGSTLNISCNNYQNCQFSIINCSDHDSCIIECGGAQSCSNTIINCPINEYCEIHCIGYKSCQNTTVNGPNGADLTVKCGTNNIHGVGFCSYSLFDGRNSNLLSIYHCSAQDSCVGITMYCPRYTNDDDNEPKCIYDG